MKRNFFPDLKVRVRVPELMDDPGLPVREHVRALAGLRRINALSRSDAILWPPLRDLARRSNRPLRVLDVATGAGDVPLRLAARFRKAGLPVELSGCDLSPVAVAAARAAGLNAFEHDVLAAPLPTGYDAVTSSLFLHHLDPPEAKVLLAHMAAAGNLVLVNDLRRCRTGWWAAWVGTRLLTRSPVVHYDGPVSVAGAFTPDEAVRLAEEAGLAGATAANRWPWRFLLSWARPVGIMPLSQGPRVDA
ncbi:MAG TPA: methyltransferase domain-containing protein [Gemmataceae bacterium]|jgi:SAM-dependent methyltransferase|nr:methyltransferase domain-containing protein [Gemmataceae bacterium]